MSNARGPVVNIVVRRDAGRYVLDVAGKLVPCLTGGPEHAKQMTERLHTALENFAYELREPPDEALAAAALHRLVVKATSVMVELFGAGRDNVFGRMLDDCCRASVGADPPPRISIMNDPEDFLPLEFLPLFTPGPAGRSPLSPALHAEISRFPAFMTIVERHLPEMEFSRGGAEALVLDNYRKLPLRLFWNDELHGSKKERQFFCQLHADEAIHLAGPRRSRPPGRDDFEAALARSLWRADGWYGKTLRVDQVQHFACHCESNAVDSHESRLGLAPDQVVTIGELLYQFDGLARSPGSRSREASSWSRRPLVFLNACQSADPPGRRHVFPQVLPPRQGRLQ